MESTIGLYKTELIKPRRPWKTLSEVELATAEWVDWYKPPGAAEFPRLIKIVLGVAADAPYARAEQEKDLRGTDLDMIERPYDGCGKCLLGVQRATPPKRRRPDEGHGHVEELGDFDQTAGGQVAGVLPAARHGGSGGFELPGPWRRAGGGVPLDGQVGVVVEAEDGRLLFVARRARWHR